jgi:hypothetical protein
VQACGPEALRAPLHGHAHPGGRQPAGSIGMSGDALLNCAQRLNAGRINTMTTRAIPAVLILFSVGCWPLAVAADAASHRQAVDRLFELTDMQQKITESVDNVLAMQLGQNPALREHRDRVRAWLEKTIGWEGLKDEVTDMYLKTFTEQELDEMNAFYGSPTGRKVIKQLPELVQQRNRIAMQRMQDNIAELQNTIEQQSAQP